MGFQHLDAFLNQVVDNGLPCCSVHVAQNGKVIYEGYFGYEDQGRTKPLNSRSVFRMASMSKLPLYTAMMMLYEQGKIVLSDPVSRFFPEWKDMKRFDYRADGNISVVPVERPITVKDTMTMMSGLPYCVSAAGRHPTEQSMAACMQDLWKRGHYTLREEIRAISGAVLAFEPGTHWMYGFSSELAAGIVETVCDKPYNDALEDMILKPLGMEDTRAHYFGDIRTRMVDVFAENPDGTFEPTTIPLDAKHEPGKENEAGCARLFSTGSDYTKLMQMLACGGEYQGVKLLGRKTIDLMRTNNLSPVQLEDFAERDGGYGYGYGVRTMIDRARGNANSSLGEFGWGGGFGTWCAADPEEKLSIVFMRNLFPALSPSLNAQIRTIVYGSID